MDTKQCTKCKEIKELNLFKKSKKIKSGFASRCKKCSAVYQKDRSHKDIDTKKQYYLDNKDIILGYMKNYYLDNREDKIEYMNQWNIDNIDYKKEYDKLWVKNNPDKVKKIRKKYYNNHVEEIKENSKIWNLKPENKVKKNNYLKKKYNNDLNYKISKSLRSLIGGSFKRSLKNEYFKHHKTTEILGCSFKEFKDYFKRLTKPEMNWDNYGEIWEIDHIIPISFATNEEDIIKLNHYSNLQPLFKTTKIAELFGYTDQIGNRNKSGKYNE